MSPAIIIHSLNNPSQVDSQLLSHCFIASVIQSCSLGNAFHSSHIFFQLFLSTAGTAAVEYIPETFWCIYSWREVTNQLHVPSALSPHQCYQSSVMHLRYCIIVDCGPFFHGWWCRYGCIPKNFRSFYAEEYYVARGRPFGWKTIAGLRESRKYAFDCA